MGDLTSNVIAIDGPSGSGKSTITQLVAKKLNLIYLDTGAMFRGIAYYLDKKGVPTTDLEDIEQALIDMDFAYCKDENTLIEIDGEDLSQKIREHHVSTLASQYSQVKIIRSYLKVLQRRLASEKPSILEGRDIGTVIFPDAAFKFYLTANNEVRAERRLEQLKQKDSSISLTKEEVMHDIIARDKEDQSRAIAPLTKADDAVEIDTSYLSIDEIVSRICEQFNSKGGF